MANRTISRRAALRGALAGGGLVAIPLPRLGAMLNGNGTAYAATGKPIQRFGVYFIKTGRPNDTPHGHFPGGLTGANGAGRVYHAPSIDQVIALQGPLGQGTDYRSIEVAVANATPGVSQKMYQAVSAKGMGQHNDPEYSPAAVFNRLFKSGADPAPAPAGGTAVVDPTVALERSVLDAIRSDAAELKKRLGREDVARLDSHLEGIRGIEQRLMRPTGDTGLRVRHLLDVTEQLPGVLEVEALEGPAGVHRVSTSLLGGRPAS
jgi:hypothetical protein